ncbi:MAG: alanine:cation symporter family protein [Balneolia bacterium]|nr:alanine:cation symporter family protein [Balneolia bacterium]
MIERLEALTGQFADFAWGPPLVALLVGGGIFFVILSRFSPYRYIGHAVGVLTGKYDDPDAEGDINHFQALSAALAATVGMGNIGGVAVAITMGGPGAIFWMWVSALVGMATKFFTCTLSIMYRGRDSEGKIQGGPMYVIREGLDKKWHPLAWFFSFCGLLGCLPLFQANQLTQIIRDSVLIPMAAVSPEAHFGSDLITGLILTAIVALVIFGGIKRIGNVAATLVPFMVVLYVVSVVYILITHIDVVPYYLSLIVTDAFRGEYVNSESMLGGAVGAVIIIGVRRAAFSNEAGIGTESMAHGAAKTNEPVREGLVAMLEPAIDTILVCTMTALAILVTGVWMNTDTDGVTLTAMAFSSGIPVLGVPILIVCVTVFALTTMFTYSYYGAKCISFLAGADKKKYFNYFYVLSIVFGSVATIGAVINLLDSAFAMMAIPTMISTILLAPKVVAASKEYFKKYDRGDFS